MTSWAVTALRNKIPDATIVWASQSRCIPVIDDTRLVDYIKEFPRERWRSHRADPTVWWNQIRTYLWARSQKFELGFDFQGHSKTAICLRLAGCKERFSSRATDALSSRLTPPISIPPDIVHEVDRAWYLINQRVECDLPPLPICPMPEVSNLARTGKPIISIQTGAGEADKRVSAEVWNKVAHHFSKEGYQVVAIGGQGDPLLEDSFATNRVGQETLRSTMSILNQSQVHLSGDTGTAHMASALGVRTVTVFGRTEPSRFQPYGQYSSVLRVGNSTQMASPEEIIAATRQSLGGAIENSR